ncbi:polysaccharide transporter [Amylolactobacillus amylotrophicus DSM 20534]|uniref:Capsular biosynthesis protein n=3 Tax=Amylolactobacillus TaxID=2767876 RepID=A0A1L6XCZ6_9LACO|nr:MULTISPECIES: oligosaccharide flippase family protein [Amylolactobacillus]APT18846.1 capsular biosynthesis protein [Amylolactobacillus amylophilus DSM 20533 = JCM 1125]KRK36904.1 polysaccharide transporter [Amylolactobacillus amylotrophicus DSM 20534]KRM41960.1 polysaccharide transporter [Amylolactobacillus amylophilus DSM 20533 = JCM 1125]GED80928.1 capsular polysaccharide biosynthesis protein [Amylolactobacillus amylophilus]
MRKTLVNIFYNAVYQIFLVLVPLITVPYISRVMGPGPYGVYSSVKFTIQFLMVFCSAAIGYIGTRTIARLRAKGSTKEMTAAFWGLWYIQAIASLVMIILTVVFVTVFKIKYWNYFYLQIPFLISAMFDIAWFFQGVEEFGRVVLRNTIVKLSSVILIFLLVKRPGDLWIYMLIMSVSTMIGSFVFWVSISQYVGRPTKSFYQLKPTIASIITLLIPQIATQVYTSLDKPILGAFVSPNQVSFYDNSQRISTMILGVITSITIVMMPKMASTGEQFQKFFVKKSYEATLFLGLIFAIVVAINTHEFVPFFFGPRYEPVAQLMMFSTLTIIFIPVGGVFANQFALATKRDKDYAIPVVVGAVLSLALSFILYPKFGAAGATATVVTTEFIVCLMRIWIVRDALDFSYIFNETPKYIIMALITLVVGFLLPQLVGNAFFDMAIKSIIVMIVYGGLFFLLKFDLNQDVLKLAKRMIKR